MNTNSSPCTASYMSNTPKPLWFVYGRRRTVTPHVESCVNIPDAESYFDMPKSMAVHVSNDWKWVAWFENMKTGTLHVLKAWNDRKSIVRIIQTRQSSKCWRFDTIRLKSNDSSQQHTDNFFNHPSLRLAEYSKCLANRYPVWRFVISCDESFDSSRFVSIRRHLQPPFQR